MTCKSVFITQMESGVLPGGSVGLKMSFQYFCGKSKPAPNPIAEEGNILKRHLFLYIPSLKGRWGFLSPCKTKLCLLYDLIRIQLHC